MIHEPAIVDNVKFSQKWRTAAMRSAQGALLEKTLGLRIDPQEPGDLR